MRLAVHCTVVGVIFAALVSPGSAQNPVDLGQRATAQDSNGAAAVILKNWSGRSGSSGHRTMTAEAILGAATNFRTCLEGFWPDVESRDVSRSTFDAAIAELTPDLRIIDILDTQPEFTQPIWEYVDSVLAADRVELGRAALTRHEPTFAAIERGYGVDRYVVAAIWGYETKYGTQMGDWPVLRSIATLACIGRRQAFFRRQFLAALSIMEHDAIRLDLMRGSWSGAFGQNQMMPTAFEIFAVDFDGDGHRDIVGSTSDALGSIAYYLKEHFWTSGQKWGLEVSLPEDFDYRLVQATAPISLSDWKVHGILQADRQPLVAGDLSASLYLPAGARGPAFLLFDNFRAIFAYNPSDSYVLAVGLLSDQLRGEPPVRHPWPRDERVLNSAERMELQTHLVALGYDFGGAPNGRICPDTRRAIGKFQMRIGMLADGFPSASVLEHLRAQDK
jgi:lytic murein transglycosylase